MPTPEAKERYKGALALYAQQKYDEAVEACREALAHDPEWTDPMHAMGMSQMNAGHLDAALETLLEVTKRAPNDPLAFTSLSMVYVRRENIEEAEAAQQTARMLTWKEEMKTNPGAPPPEPMG